MELNINTGVGKIPVKVIDTFEAYGYIWFLHEDRNTAECNIAISEKSSGYGVPGCMGFEDVGDAIIHFEGIVQHAAEKRGITKQECVDSAIEKAIKEHGHAN